MRPRPPLLLALLLLIAGCTPRLVGPERAQRYQSDRYVESLARRAVRMRLHESRQWLRLVHYRPERYGPGHRSEADHPNFFLARHGQGDPRAEIVATVRGLFEPPIEELKVGEAGRARHPICRFPARLAFLVEALGIDLQRLPTQPCPRYAKFMADLNPQSVTVVFSSYYLNNPSSAFGHSFLRFNKAQTPAIGKKRELLDYAVNFAADVDTDNALIYAIKGLFGLFPGTITRVPYYYKVRQYADTESRDIWEYHLDLTPRQLYMLSAHIWELGNTHFAYFYLDENCSYRINMMLEAANPDIELIDSLGAIVLPVDTIKVLFDNPGLVKGVSYRPSLRTQFMHKVAALDSKQREYVERLAADPNAKLAASWSDPQKVAVLDAALDLIDVRHLKDLIFKRDSAAANRKQRLLERRAAIRVPSRDTPIKTPLLRMPHIGHDSMRAGLGVGYRHSRTGGLRGEFATLDLRVSMHDLADPSTGYPELAQLEFMRMSLRLWRNAGPNRDRDPKLTLDDGSLVRIVSLTSMQQFDMSLSWHVDLGARTLEGAGCKRCLAGKIRGGTGLAHSIASDALTLFATADLALYVAGKNAVGIAGGPARAGFGPAGGLRLRIWPQLISLTRAEWLFYPEQPDPRLWQLDSTLRWGMGKAIALSLEGRMQTQKYDGQVLLLGYF